MRWGDGESRHTHPELPTDPKDSETHRRGNHQVARFVESGQDEPLVQLRVGGVAGAGDGRALDFLRWRAVAQCDALHRG